MLSMIVDHPDIEEFITIKSDMDKVTKANISVRVTNEFMEAVKNNKPFELYYLRPETGEEITKTVDAKALFALICQQAWDNAEPGILFWDRIDQYNLMQKDDNYKLAGTNPCVSGDTLLLTSKGYVPIKDVIDQEIEVWNGKDFTLSTPQITGYDQPMVRITLDDGCSIECTDYHKFILDDNTRVEANQLRVGQKLAKSQRWPLIEGTKEIAKKIAYTQGFFMGDGCECNNSNRRMIHLYGKKRNLIKYLDFNSANCRIDKTSDVLNLKRDSELYNKSFVPDASYTIQTRLSWLAGYIDSDGCRNSEDGSISISSINFDVLMKVKLMLNTLGANGKIGLMKDECYKMMSANDNNGNMRMYHCEKCYRIIISAFHVKMLKKIGLKTNRVSLKCNPNRDAGRFPRVISIKRINDAEVVYCLNEKGNHSVIFNGIYTGNCGELPLPGGGACLLGSINLAEFVKEDKTFDFNDFECVVFTAIHALNEVLDEGIKLHPLQIQRDSAENWRPIGLGIMGLADMLIKMEIVYGSKESIDLCDEIGKRMARCAISQSIEDAEQRTEFPNCDRCAITNSEFFENHAHPTADLKVLESGIRNSQLLTIPPTGSLANMLGISNGIEPIFDKFYTRRTETLNDGEKIYRIYTQIVWDYMQNHGIQEGEEDKLPEFFVTAKEIPYKDRLMMQSIWQSHIDNSISSTINLPHETSVEDVMDLYMTAWEYGLKGVTIFREGCKRAPILDSSKKEDKKNESKMVSDEENTNLLFIIAMNQIDMILDQKIHASQLRNRIRRQLFKVLSKYDKEELCKFVDDIVRGDIPEIVKTHTDAINKEWKKHNDLLNTEKIYSPEPKEGHILERGEVIKAPANSIGKKRDLMTGCGSLHFQAFFDQENGNVVETYLSKGSKGGCNSFMIGLSRMISLLGRAGVDIYTIVDQLHSVPSCTSYVSRRSTKHDVSKGTCCPAAVGHALIEMYEEVKDEIELGGVYKGSPLYYKLKAERDTKKKTDNRHQKKGKIKEEYQFPITPDYVKEVVNLSNNDILEELGISQTTNVVANLLSIPGIGEVLSNLSDEDIEKFLETIRKSTYSNSIDGIIDSSCSNCKKDHKHETITDEPEYGPVPKELFNVMVEDLKEKTDGEIYDWINEENNREKSARLFSALVDHPHFVTFLVEDIRKGKIVSLEDMIKKIEYGLKPVGMGSLNPVFADIQDTLKEKYAEDAGLCPECGTPLTFEGGCNTCKSCGWSKCD